MTSRDLISHVDLRRHGQAVLGDALADAHLPLLDLFEPEMVGVEYGLRMRDIVVEFLALTPGQREDLSSTDDQSGAPSRAGRTSARPRFKWSNSISKLNSI